MSARSTTNDTSRVERVAFLSEGEQLVGDLHRPAPERAGGAGVVVSGSWGTIKEQMASRYARGLAEAGYTALAFDFRGYGESGGGPRDAELPEHKIVDLTRAAQFLATVPGVEDGRIGGLGVCAGSGYVAGAAATGAMTSIAMAAPWLHDASLVREVYGGDGGVASRIADGDRARQRWEEAGEVEYVPTVSTTDERAAMYGPFDYYLDTGRGAIPQWDNRFAVLSWPEWLRFDAIAIALRVTVPVAMVHSEDGAIPDGVRRFAAGLSGPGELSWLPGTQFDFYDDEPTVVAALAVVCEHFGRTL